MMEELMLTEEDVGGWFLTRDGRTAVINAVIKGERSFPFEGIIKGNTSETTWRVDGRFLDQLNRPGDLIARIGTKEDADALSVAQSFKDL